MIIEVMALCLALNIYFEARGEPLQGQYAVAEVTLKRGDISSRNICQEVFLDRQFSWTLDQNPVVTNNKSWLLAQTVAADALKQGTNYSRGATHYHAITWKGRPFRKPAWAYRLCETVRIGNHVFYKPCD